MNEKTARQIEEMKKQTIGVEVEMNVISRKRAARLIAEHFGTDSWYANSDFGYDTYACRDGQGRVWKFQRDVSIQGRDDCKTEMVTPILHYEDIEDLQAIIRILRRAGAKSDPTRGCGVHVHIGADGQTPKSMRNLANIMASHEQLIIDALGLSRDRVNRWCQTVDRNFLEEVNRRKPQTMSSFADVWYTSQGAGSGRSQHYNSSRYHMLNYHATFTKGIIEFRLFEFEAPDGERQNGLHAGQLKAYIQFCLALCQLAKDAKAASSKPQQNENPKYAMRTWLLRLGFIGDEFKTAREVLTKKLAGDASFRKGRPAA